jgi:hypothetical protein
MKHYLLLLLFVCSACDDLKTSFSIAESKADDKFYKEYYITQKPGSMLHIRECWCEKVDPDKEYLSQHPEYKSHPQFQYFFTIYNNATLNDSNYGPVWVMGGDSSISVAGFSGDAITHKHVYHISSSDYGLHDSIKVAVCHMLGKTYDNRNLQPFGEIILKPVNN